MIAENIVDVSGLTRVFTVRDKSASGRGWFSRAATKQMVAVSDLNFSIRVGEKVAFIGPNGAGKSTTLRMLSGLLSPTAGTALVCDLVPWEQTRDLSHRIGLVFGQRSHLWPHLSRQTEKLIDVFGLAKFFGQKAGTLSLGQRMRCDIAASLLHQPSILFLDEPTIGLDVTAKALLRDHLNRLVSEFETTVLLTSHDTDDIEKICERVVLIDRGQKLLDTTLSALHRDYRRTKTLRLVTEEACPLFEHEGVTVEERADHALVLAVDLDRASVESVVGRCLERFVLRDLTIEDMPLEEIIKEIYRRTKAARVG